MSDKVSTIYVTLSTDLVTELTAGNGVYVEAFNYDSNGAIGDTLMVNDGTIVGGSDTFAIPITSQVDSGKLYFLVQSLATDAPASDIITNAITSQSDVTWGSATKLDYSFDSFEYNLAQSTDDVGNLTAVAGYGLPIGVRVSNVDGATSVGYSVSGAALTNQLGSISANVHASFTQGPLAGLFREAVSPATALDPDSGIQSPPFNAGDWSQYVKVSQESASSAPQTGDRRT